MHRSLLSNGVVSLKNLIGDHKLIVIDEAQNIPDIGRNLRKEITKTSRYYFVDLGIRNALINNFNPLSLRNDIDALWEIYLPFIT